MSWVIRWHGGCGVHKSCSGPSSTYIPQHIDLCHFPIDLLELSLKAGLPLELNSKDLVHTTNIRIHFGGRG